ncbi:MAG: HAMP domain-containing histidine kinase [Alphaproteobacteria bacterium]|nr:HAMP domain-containing histidine kinase [Alphaproteobacteria bacterium]
MPAAADGSATPVRGRAPAALVLGTLAGVLASMAVLPTIVPLSQRVAAAEELGVLAEVVAASRATAVLYDSNLPLRAGLARSLDAGGVEVTSPGGEQLFHDGVLPRGVSIAVLCPPGEAPGRFVAAEDGRWAVACHDVGTGLAVAASPVTHRQTRTISYLVVGLAAMVGISTAFGVLQLLSPLSRIREGLERMGTGERGVRVQTTGLAELDELVARLNSVTRAIEDREDAITGRIQVVQEMARVVAHEIRNPLQSIELLAGLIAAEEEREERQELASSIQGEVRILERVVSRMLRGGEGPALRITRRPTSLRDLLHKIVAFRLAEARHRGIQLVEGPVPAITVSVDPTLLSRALENLVVNALAFAPSHTGRVEVQAQVEDEDLVVQVDDNGPGVPEEFGDAIYQAEITTRPGGTGLGLTLVQGVLTAHGGYVEHGRSPLGGARFRAHLPLRGPGEEEDERADPGGG